MPKSDTARSRASAADLLGPVLKRQAIELRAREANLRLERPQSVRKFVVASRRLGGSLAGFADLLDPVTGELLLRELRDIAAAVGAAREAESVQHRIGALLQDEGPARNDSGTHERLARHLRDLYRASLHDSLAYLDSPEYDAFVRRLEAFVDLPTWTDAAQGRAEKVLRPLLRAEWARFRKRTHRALAGEAGPEEDVRMHDARKTAKRVRYVCESLVPLFGRKAKRMGKAAEQVQVVLGDRQDCVLTQRVLGEAGEQAFRDGENPFLLGRLQAREAAVALELRADFARLADAADRPSLRRWLD